MKILRYLPCLAIAVSMPGHTFQLEFEDTHWSRPRCLNLYHLPQSALPTEMSIFKSLGIETAQVCGIALGAALLAEC